MLSMVCILPVISELKIACEISQAHHESPGIPYPNRYPNGAIIPLYSVAIAFQFSFDFPTFLHFVILCLTAPDDFDSPHLHLWKP